MFGILCPVSLAQHHRIAHFHISVGSQEVLVLVVAAVMGLGSAETPGFQDSLCLEHIVVEEPVSKETGRFLLFPVEEVEAGETFVNEGGNGVHVGSDEYLWLEPLFAIEHNILIADVGLPLVYNPVIFSHISYAILDVEFPTLQVTLDQKGAIGQEHFTKIRQQAAHLR